MSFEIYTLGRRSIGGLVSSLFSNFQLTLAMHHLEIGNFLKISTTVTFGVTTYIRSSLGPVYEFVCISIVLFLIYIQPSSIFMKNIHPPVTFSREIATEYFDISSSHISGGSKCCVMYFTITFLF